MVCQVARRASRQARSFGVCRSCVIAVGDLLDQAPSSSWRSSAWAS